MWWLTSSHGVSVVKTCIWVQLPLVPLWVIGRKVIQPKLLSRASKVLPILIGTSEPFNNVMICKTKHCSLEDDTMRRPANAAMGFATVGFVTVGLRQLGLQQWGLLQRGLWLRFVAVGLLQLGLWQWVYDSGVCDSGFMTVGFAATGFVTVRFVAVGLLQWGLQQWGLRQWGLWQWGFWQWGFGTVGFVTVRFAAGRFVRVGFVAAVGFMIVGFAVLQKLAEDKVSLQQRRDVLKRTMQQLSSEYEALKKQLTENETYVQVDSCTAFLPPPRRLLFSSIGVCLFVWCKQDYCAINFHKIRWKGGTWVKKLLDFGGKPGHITVGLWSGCG